MTLNTRLVIRLFQELYREGVRELCICPGARNAPLIAILTANPGQFKTYYFFEERSASFFALGRIRSTGRPVPVLTTSGTAAGELLPATMEAHYSGLALVLITADRPRSYRGSGAPQVAEQVGLYGSYVCHSADIASEEDFEKTDSSHHNNFSHDNFSHDFISHKSPTHLNICFDEPLIDSEYPASVSSLLDFGSTTEEKRSAEPSQETLSAAKTALAAFFQKVRNPLVIVGMIHPQEREALAQLLLQWQIPTYFEGLSGLREDPRFDPFKIHLSDRLMERASQNDYPIDGVLRIGGVPTLRLWRDLETKYRELMVLTLSRMPFSGLARSSSVVHGDLNFICNETWIDQNLVEPDLESRFQQFLKQDHQALFRLKDLLLDEPLSEPGMIAALSRRLSAPARVYLGNSLPIREWDLVAELQNHPLSDIWGSRGLNGIDGQISTFLGYAESHFENWAIVGDLTALYDLQGPWILPQIPKVQVNILIVNNGGGKIFSRMFPQEEIQNRHQIGFRACADLWGLSYERWETVPQKIEKQRGNRMIEMIPDENATQRFWTRYQQIE